MADLMAIRCAVLLLVLASADSTECMDYGCEGGDDSIMLLQQQLGSAEFVRPGTLGGATPLAVGHITAVAGTPGVSGTTPDGRPARGALLGSVGGVHFHPMTEELWVSDQGNNALRVVDHSTGTLRTVAGTVGRCSGVEGTPNWHDFCADPHDGAPARDCHFNMLHGIDWDLETNGTYITDSINNAIRYIDPKTHTISSAIGHAPNAGYSGDGGLASDSLLNFPHCVVMDQKTKDLYVADGFNSAVRKVDGKTGIISTLWTQEGTVPMDFDLVKRPDGGMDLYLAEMGLNTVQRIDTVTGHSIIIAGKPQKKFVHSGDGGLAKEAELSSPTGVQYDPSTGDIYISEYMGHTVRKIDGTYGIITTIAGKADVAGSSGDDGPAKDALLDGPAELHFVPKYGWLFVQDSGNFAVRLIQL